MKIAKAILAASLTFGVGSGLLGCNSTHDAGVTSDLHSQWTDVSTNAKATTDAAKAVLTADALLNVTAQSTDIDGKVTAEKADGTKITVLIKQVGIGSQVTVTVGELGDPTLGAGYAARIKAKAEGH